MNNKPSAGRLKVVRIRGGERTEEYDCVTSEVSLKIYINGEVSLSVMCSGHSREYLVYGLLFSLGIIEKIEDIESVSLWGGYCRVETALKKEIPRFVKTLTSGCGNTFSFVSALPDKKKFSVSGLSVRREKIIGLMKALRGKSESYKKTGGTHSAALSDGEDLLFFGEDIGRHNAFDRVAGEALAGRVSLSGKILLISGRISSEIMAKCIRAGIAVIASRSAPTDYAVKLAGYYGITVIGFLRGDRFNIYSHSGRIL